MTRETSNNAHEPSATFLPPNEVGAAPHSLQTPSFYNCQLDILMFRILQVTVWLLQAACPSLVPSLLHLHSPWPIFFPHKNTITSNSNWKHLSDILNSMYFHQVDDFWKSQEVCHSLPSSELLWLPFILNRVLLSHPKHSIWPAPAVPRLPGDQSPLGNVEHTVSQAFWKTSYICVTSVSWGDSSTAESALI